MRWLFSAPARLLRSFFSDSVGRTPALRWMRRATGFVFRSSLVEPSKWLIQIVGLGLGWAKSRRWGGALLWGLPSVILVGLVGLVWMGGRLDRLKLSMRYMELGEAEIGDWESSFSLQSGLAADSRAISWQSGEEVPSPPTAQPATRNVSPYGEMLFRRIHLLDPSSRSNLVIGFTMAQRGAINDALRVLKRIAPDEDIGNPVAHAIVAAIYFEQLKANPRVELATLFQHHAVNGVRWRHMPSEILLASGHLMFQMGDSDRGLAMLQLAAERNPDLYPILVTWALQADQPTLADQARSKGIAHFRSVLASDPQKHAARALLAELLSNTLSGLDQAEELLKQGLERGGNPILSRALSEVYRQRFVLHDSAGGDTQAGIVLLDKAMGFDPGNPRIAEEVAVLIHGQFGNPTAPVTDDQNRLLRVMNELLAVGNATTCTHALFAEYHLSGNRRSQAIVHLEQIFWVAPTAAKYANELARAYLEMGRLADASKLANHALVQLKAKQLLGEKYVDELSHTLGRIYQQQQQLDQAIQLYKFTLRLNPTRQETRASLASCYRLAGLESQATTIEKSLAEWDRTLEEQREFNNWLTQLVGGPASELNPGPSKRRAGEDLLFKPVKVPMRDHEL